MTNGIGNAQNISYLSTDIRPYSRMLKGDDTTRTRIPYGAVSLSTQQRESNHFLISTCSTPGAVPEAVQSRIVAPYAAR